MSFIYAEKIEKSLHIYSDTKISFNNNSGASFSKEQMVLLNKYGIIKTTIICPTICISYAGNNIFLASELFLKLYEKRTVSLQDVLDLAMEIHLSAKKDDIEFIISSCEDNELLLHCIKEGELQSNCSFAWIGSVQAHRLFQSIRLSGNNKKASDRTSTAFAEVVSSGKDETVGGLMIEVIYKESNNCFQYEERWEYNSSKAQTVKAGETVKWYLDAKDGGFSYQQIPISCEEVIIAIDQMDSQILYSRNHRCTQKDTENTQLFSLMLPLLVRRDESGQYVRC